MINENIGANLPGRENAEKDFINHWTKKSNNWFLVIEDSDLSLQSKLELKNIIKMCFIRGYINNKNRGSITIFTRPLSENLSMEGENVDDEDNKRDKIIEHILSDIEDLMLDPRKN